LTFGAIERAIIKGETLAYSLTDMSVEEYRTFAKECLDWARTAKSDREREIFEQMALTWIEAAERSERITQRTNGSTETVLSKD
jgi:hypothetical protein